MALVVPLQTDKPIFMKKHFVSITRPLLLVSVLFLFMQAIQAQIVNEATRKKFSIGVGMFTDIWNNVPYYSYKGSLPLTVEEQFDMRSINQGFQALALYNVPFGRSPLGFSIGLGFRAENLYVKDAYFKSTRDSTYMVRVPDSIYVRRSKLALPYIELPVEFYIKTKFKMVVAAGFKIGYMFPAHAKFVGENYNYYDPVEYRYKQREIQNLETFSYGPTFRIGYRWFHAYSYFSISKIFKKDKGPDMYPITVGFLLMPY
jgi:hypothetical protein